MKGKDHAGSLGPDGVNRMVRDIRLLEMSLGKKDLFACEDVAPAKIKLERSVASNRLIRQGEIIGEQDIHLLSPGDGVRWAERGKIVGRIAVQDIPCDEIIYLKMVR
jgi:sialic acid synthase